MSECLLTFRTHQDLHLPASLFYIYIYTYMHVDTYPTYIYIYNIYNVYEISFTHFNYYFRRLQFTSFHHLELHSSFYTYIHIYLYINNRAHGIYSFSFYLFIFKLYIYIYTHTEINNQMRVCGGGGQISHECHVSRSWWETELSESVVF